MHPRQKKVEMNSTVVGQKVGAEEHDAASWAKIFRAVSSCDHSNLGTRRPSSLITCGNEKKETTEGDRTIRVEKASPSMVPEWQESKISVSVGHLGRLFTNKLSSV